MRIILTLMLGFLALFGQAAEKRVVFDLVTGDLKRFEQIVLTATETHTSHYGALQQHYKAVFVIHGEAYRFFMKSLKGTRYEGDTLLLQRHEELAARLAELAETYDVTFEACSVGMRHRNISEADLYPFVTPIFSAVAGLIEWQEKGYAYVPVN